jgi:hypothetical protein
MSILLHYDCNVSTLLHGVLKEPSNAQPLDEKNNVLCISIQAWICIIKTKIVDESDKIG